MVGRRSEPEDGHGDIDNETGSEEYACGSDGHCEGPAFPCHWSLAAGVGDRVFDCPPAELERPGQRLGEDTVRGCGL